LPDPVTEFTRLADAVERRDPERYAEYCRAFGR
jgi:hypothetical protein